MLLVPAMVQPTPAMPFPFRLLYVRATSGCMLDRPGGISIGILYTAAPPSTEGCPGRVPTHSCGGAFEGGGGSPSGKVESTVITCTLAAAVNALHAVALHDRTRYEYVPYAFVYAFDVPVTGVVAAAPPADSSRS